MFRVLQETQGAMPDVGKKYLANIVLIPQLQVTFDFVVAAMPDSNGFLSVCRGPPSAKESWKYSGDMSGVVKVMRFPVVVFLRWTR